MISSEIKYGVGIVPDRQQLRQACQELRRHNFSLKNVAAIPATEGAIKGAIAGGLLALVGGLSVMLIPGVGIPLAAESLLTVLAGSGASTAVGGFVGGMRGWFLPDEAANIYRDRVFKGNYLIIVKGSQDELNRARLLLANWQIREWRVYDESEYTVNKSYKL
ncbi:MAG: hypothetical protein RLZZ535_2515 [Cyanobacteriota bacterium]|jgi:hypothetical protein